MNQLSSVLEKRKVLINLLAAAAEEEAQRLRPSTRTAPEPGIAQPALTVDTPAPALKPELTVGRPALAVECPAQRTCRADTPAPAVALPRCTAERRGRPDHTPAPALTPELTVYIPAPVAAQTVEVPALPRAVV